MTIDNSIRTSDDATVAITADTLGLFAGEISLSADHIRAAVGQLQNCASQSTEAGSRLRAVAVPPVGAASGFSSLAGEFVDRSARFVSEHARDLGDTAAAVGIFCARVQEEDRLG